MQVSLPTSPSASRLAGLAHDARYGVRLFRRQPGYALVAILTLALGIGATTSLSSLAYGVLLKPLPWRDADRLVRLYETRKGGTNRLGPIMTSAPYVAWRESAATIEGLGAWTASRVTMTLAGESARLRLAWVTIGLFPLLGVQPLIGTSFTAADELVEQQPPVILSHGLWEERFGARPDAVGQTVAFDGQTCRIAGVMPRTFAFPDRETRAWVPMAVRFAPKGLSIFNAIARLKPGVTPEQAAAEATARGRSGPDPGVVVMAVFGSREPLEISAIPLLESQVSSVRPAIIVLLIGVGLLLGTATANVASIQLARATGRRREIAIRSALGAGGGRLARQFLVESLLLGLAGGGTGLLLAVSLRAALPAILPPSFPRLDDVSVDLRVAVFCLGLSLVTSLALGLLPALAARRAAVVELLAEDGWAPIGGTGRVPAARARMLIMTGQVAIACVLLLGGTLLGRSFVSLLNADRGYDPANVLTAMLPLPDERYTGQQRAALVTALLDRLRAVPGIRHAAFTTALPLTPGDVLASFPVRSPRTGASVQAHAVSRLVSPDYFAALGVRVVEGRAFDLTDTPSSRPVVIVNRAFARQYLGDQPLGRKLWDDTKEAPGPEVVGVVDDVRHRSVTDPPGPEIYRTHIQSKAGIVHDQLALALKTTGQPEDLASTLRAIARQQDPSLAIDSIVPMESLLRTSLAQPRLYSVVLGGFAVFALAIAGVGLFGVLACSVAQRSREIGVRTAIGARPRDIAALVLRQGVSIAAAGVAVGLLASIAGARWLSGILYGIGPYDPVSFTFVPALLVVVSVLACLVPARRAARLDPIRALKQ